MPFDYPVAGASAPATGGAPREEAMSLKPYTTTVNGYETTLLLSEEDAKAQGLTEQAADTKPAPAKKAAAPANKARKTAANKAK